MSGARILFILPGIALFLSVQSGCEKNTVEDHILVQSDVEITFVDNETGAFLMGPDKVYEPSLIRVYNQNWEDIGVEPAECLGNDFGLFFMMYNGDPAKALSFDTTYYVQLSESDVDTLRFTYAYSKKEDYYYQLIKYNDSLYNQREKHFDCAILLYKKQVPL